MPPEIGKLLWRADRVGKNIGALCREIHRREAQAGVRRIQGILSLARKHEVLLVEDACGAALEIGVPTYRFVRRYLERRAATLPLFLRQVDPLIRQLTEYSHFIDRRTQEERR